MPRVRRRARPLRVRVSSILVLQQPHPARTRNCFYCLFLVRGAPLGQLLVRVSREHRRDDAVAQGLRGADEQLRQLVDELAEGRLRVAVDREEARDLVGADGDDRDGSSCTLPATPRPPDWPRRASAFASPFAVPAAKPMRRRWTGMSVAFLAWMGSPRIVSVFDSVCMPSSIWRTRSERLSLMGHPAAPLPKARAHQVPADGRRDEARLESQSMSTKGASAIQSTSPAMFARGARTAPAAARRPSPPRARRRIVGRAMHAGLEAVEAHAAQRALRAAA